MLQGNLLIDIYFIVKDDLIKAMRKNTYTLGAVVRLIPGFRVNVTSSL